VRGGGEGLKRKEKNQKLSWSSGVPLQISRDHQGMDHAAHQLPRLRLRRTIPDPFVSHLPASVDGQRIFKFEMFA
jgi:hypothetical protein